MDAGTIFALVLIIAAICIIGFALYDNMASLDDAKHVIMASDNQRDNDVQAITAQFKDMNTKVNNMEQQQQQNQQLVVNNIQNLQSSLSTTTAQMTETVNNSVKANSSAFGKMPSQIGILQAQMSNLMDPTQALVKDSIVSTTDLQIGHINMKQELHSLVMEISNLGQINNFAFKDDGTFGSGTLDPQMGLDINNADQTKLGIRMMDPNSKKYWQMRMTDDIDSSLLFSSDTSPEPQGVLALSRSGRLGLGTRTPLTTIDVHGNMSVTNNVGTGTVDIDPHLNYMTIGGSLGTILTSHGNNSVYVLSDSNANVKMGVGLSQPLEALHVNGNMILNGSNVNLGGNKSVLKRTATGTILSDQSNIAFNIGNADAIGSVSVASLNTSNVTLNKDTTVNGKLSLNSSAGTPAIIQLNNLILKTNPGTNKLQICQADANGTTWNASTCTTINTT